MVALGQAYAGSYGYAGGDTERKAVAAAVEHALAGLAFLAKPAARQSLKQRAEIRDSYTLSFDGLGGAQITSPGFPAESGGLDGRPFALESKSAEQTQASLRFVSGTLVEEGHSEEGSGRTEFRLTDAGQTLLVHRTLHGPQLPSSVDFTLTYRRQ